MKSIVRLAGTNLTRISPQTHRTFKSLTPVLLGRDTDSPTFFHTTGVPTSNRPILDVRNQLSYCQPTPHSYPEFYRNHDDIIPGISRTEYKDRREKLCSLLSTVVSEDTAHIILIPAASKKYMTENIPFPFRQDSNFFYFTGCYEAEAILVLTVSCNGDQAHNLFIPDPDRTSITWEGHRTSVVAAEVYLGLDKAFNMSTLESFIHDFAASSDHNFVVWGENNSTYVLIEKIFTPIIGNPSIITPKTAIDSLRVIKSLGEIELMRESARITSEAFRATMKYCSGNSKSDESTSEHRIWAKMDYECRIRGADRLAYPPVVASGSRANIIHYVHNRNLCKTDELCLVDAGCEFFGYCSDVTRTFPVSGKFSSDYQRSLYELVLDVQQKVIEKVEPGESLDSLFHYMGKVMLQGLQELGLVSKSLDHTSKATEIALHFCPHHVSHYLGMDVHDTPTINRHVTLKPGTIITVEPGIYINAKSSQGNLLTPAGKEFDGIGIRIEDDVLVTSSGRDVLTAPCPKLIRDIESLSDP